MNKLLTLLILTLFTNHAYSQKFTNSHTVGNETKAYSKILVVAKARNPTKRREMEDDIVKRFDKKGIIAIPSYLRLPDEAIKKGGKDEEALEKFVSKLRENSFDGVLVTSLVDSDQSVDYNPGTYRTTRVPVRYGRFGRYYGTTRVAVYKPGSVEKHRDFIMESLLYDLRGSSKENSLHWIGKIKISDPADFDKASDKYAKALVKRVMKEAVE